MTAHAPLRSLLPLALALAACRSPPDDLVGDWAGTLDCAEDDLVYTTTVMMSLETPEAGRHPGTLALQTAWLDADGVDRRQTSGWTVALRQEFPSGVQDVDFVQADCTEASRTSDGQLTAEGCDDVGGGIGTSSLSWDGADSLAWGGGCTGALTRGGTIDADSGDPGEGAR